MKKSRAVDTDLPKTTTFDRYSMPLTEDWQKWLFEKYFKTYPQSKEVWAFWGFYDLEHGCVSDLGLAWYDDMLAMNSYTLHPTIPEMRMYRDGHRRTNQGWVPAPEEAHLPAPDDTEEVPF